MGQRVYRPYDPDRQSRRSRAHASATSPELLTNVLRVAGEKSSKQGGLVSSGTRTSFRKLNLLSDRLAQALVQAGVEPGDRVVAVLPNSVEFVVTCFAVWKARAIVVPEDPAIRPTNLLYILRETEPTALVVDRHMVARLEGVGDLVSSLKAVFVKGCTTSLSGLADVHVESLEAILKSTPRTLIPLPMDAGPDEVVSITFTSGSTGIPKGVLHSHKSWLAGAAFTRDYLQLTANDKIVIPLPLHHAYAFRHILAHILAGAGVVIVDNIYKALKVTREQQPTALLLVPTACNIILDHFSPLLREADTFLRYVEIGTSAMPPERLSRLRELLPTTQIHLSYGLTEARVGYLKPGKDGMPNCIAYLAPGLKLWVVNSTGEPVEAGHTGEIVLQGVGLMEGYWRHSEAEQVRLRECGFHTGDIGWMDDCGEVELLGRMDEVLKVGGRKAIPLEVEMTLNRHPAVLESVVVGLPDPRGLFEQQLHAYVVVKDGHAVTSSELAAHCQRYLEPYKIPAHIHFRSSLPKSPVGKVQRHVLAAEHTASVSSLKKEECHAGSD